MHIKQLNYFVAVAEELHFGRAAARLHISQPPLSMHIKALESRLGVTLFERDRRSVKLTLSGSTFLQHAYRIVQQLQAAMADAQCAERGEVGTLRIGYSRSALYCDKTLSHIAAYRKKYPGIELQLQEGSTHNLISHVASNRIDIGLVRGALPSAVEPFTHQLVSTEPLVVIFPSTHWLAKKKDEKAPISIKDLKDECFVMFETRSRTALTEFVTTLLINHEVRPNIAIETNSMSGIVGLVSAGLGISIIPASVARSHWSTVNACTLHETRAHIQLYAIAQPEISLAVQNFFNILHD